MKNILAENMLRFGTKNIGNVSKQQLLTILEQAELTKTDQKSNTGATAVKDKNQLKLDAEKDARTANIDDLAADNMENAYITTDATALTKLGTAKNYLQSNAAKNPNANKIEPELQSKYGDTYLDFIRNLHAYDQRTGSAGIWFLKLKPENRIQFLDQFKQWKSTVTKDKYTITIKRGTTNRELIDPPAAPAIPPIIPLPLKTAGDGVFVDNLSDLTANVKATVDQWIDSIKKQKDEISNQNPGIQLKYVLGGLLVAASASRFRNTGVAADLSWRELTEARGLKVKEYILTQLQAIGVDITKVMPTPIGLGYNKDGTSGPQPGKNKNGAQYTLTSDGKFNNVIKETPEALAFPGIVDAAGTQATAPHATKEEYDQYKFVLAAAHVSVVANETDVPKPGVKVSGTYIITFNQMDKGTVVDPNSRKQPKHSEWQLKDKKENPALKCFNFGDKGWWHDTPMADGKWK
jgi:hypothetical protein